MPDGAGGGTTAALVGVGAVKGSSTGALALYWDRRFSRCFWSCRLLVCDIFSEDIAFERSLC